MTNGEKYLKEGVDIKQFAEMVDTAYVKADKYADVCESTITWLKEQAKPTLTEDERVILRNINTNNYDKVGRKISGALYLGIVNEIGIDSTFEDFFQDSDLFQFIKERRRI